MSKGCPNKECLQDNCNHVASRMVEIDRYKFTAKLHLEGSWGSRKLGEHQCEMILFVNSENPRHGCIDFDAGKAGVENIGLTFDENKNLLDYDGVFSLPHEAIELLRANGYTVGEEFEL